MWGETVAADPFRLIYTFTHLHAYTFKQEP